MRYRDGRRSVCVSSQSGCPLTCTFCATGQMRFGRNLTAGEILDQALHFRRIEPIDHLVFMGMGEPMLNLDPVLEAARRLPDLGVTHRRTTISTVGWLPGPARASSTRSRSRSGSRSRCTRPTPALRSTPDAGQRPLPARRRARRVPPLRRAARPEGLRRVRDARAASTTAPSRPRSSRRSSTRRRFKVNLIPYNPTGRLRRLLARGDRRVQGGARPARACRRRSGSRAAARSRPPAGSSRPTRSSDLRRLPRNALVSVRQTTQKERSCVAGRPRFSASCSCSRWSSQPPAAGGKKSARRPRRPPSPRRRRRPRRHGDGHHDARRPRRPRSSSALGDRRRTASSSRDLGSQFSAAFSGANGDSRRRPQLLKEFARPDTRRHQAGLPDARRRVHEDRRRTEGRRPLQREDTRRGDAREAA